MTPIQIADKYCDTVSKTGTYNRRLIFKYTGHKLTTQDTQFIAKKAIWLAATENPRAPVPTVLLKAKRLFSKWLREDYLPMFAEALREKRDYPSCITHYDVEEKFELEDEVYHGLDTVIRNYGIHAGLWTILALILQDPQKKSNTMYKYIGIKPTSEQKKLAHKIINKLKTLL